MKVLFVSEYFLPKIMGGGEINLNLLVKALAKKGVEVFVLTSYHKGLKVKEEGKNVKIFRTLKTGDSPQGLKNNLKRSRLSNSIEKEVKKFIIRNKVDIIHLIGSSVISAGKLKDLKIPLAATIESYPSLCPKGDMISKENCCNKGKCSFRKFLVCQKNSSEIGKTENKFYLKYNLPALMYIYGYYKKMNHSLKYCNLIAISEHIKNVLAQQNFKSTVIPNSINLDNFKAGKKVKNKKTRIVYLGSLTKYKGPQILLKAVKGLNCRTDLYGEGTLKYELVKTIHFNKLDAKIHSPVSYDLIPKIYSETDIVVFPSIWPEPFGRISIEAMAAGKPVIGSNIGGIKETIEPGTGILVKPGSVYELREAILELSSGKKKLDFKKVREVLVEKYSEDKVVNTLIDFYKGMSLPS